MGQIPNERAKAIARLIIFGGPASVLTICATLCAFAPSDYRTHASMSQSISKFARPILPKGFPALLQKSLNLRNQLKLFQTMGGTRLDATAAPIAARAGMLALAGSDIMTFNIERKIWAIAEGCIHGRST